MPDLMPDYRWIMSNRGKLASDYPNRFVAVLDGKVVASGPKHMDAVSALNEKEPADSYRARIWYTGKRQNLMEADGDA